MFGEIVSTWEHNGLRFIEAWSEKWIYPESESLRLPAHTDIELPEPERVGHAPPPPQSGAETREEESDGEEVVEVARQADGQGRYVPQPQ